MDKQFRIKHHQHYDEDGWVSKEYYSIEEFKWELSFIGVEYWKEIVYYTYYGMDKSSHVKEFGSVERAQKFIEEVLMEGLLRQKWVVSIVKYLLGVFQK